jgi:hypothetical protein
MTSPNRFAVLHELLTTNCVDLGETVKHMYRIALEDLSLDNEGTEYFACMGIDDQYARQRGVYGTIDEVRRQVVEFLERYASRL